MSMIITVEQFNYFQTLQKEREMRMKAAKQANMKYMASAKGKQTNRERQRRHYWKKVKNLYHSKWNPDGPKPTTVC